MIKLFHPFVSWRAVLYTTLLLMRGKQLAEGPTVRRFEKEYQRMSKIGREVVAVNSGTSALEIAYELAGIGKGDEVITPVLTCTATNLPLVRRGAKIVFADITKDLLMDLADADSRITKKTKAVVVVFFGGAEPANFEMFCDKWRKRGIKVIVDAAQAIGIPFGFFRRPRLWYADYTCISFQAIKFLTAGDGGAIICQDQDDTQKAKKLRWFGYNREEKQRLGDTDLTLAGYKMHMNDVSAAIALGNLRSIKGALKRRYKIAKKYADRLPGSGRTLQIFPWLVGIVAQDAAAIEKRLKEAGIECGQYHFRNDRYTVMGPRRKDLPMMDKLEEQYLFLPYHHKMRFADVDLIMNIINGR